MALGVLPLISVLEGVYNSDDSDGVRALKAIVLPVVATSEDKRADDMSECKGREGILLAGVALVLVADCEDRDVGMGAAGANIDSTVPRLDTVAPFLSFLPWKPSTNNSVPET